MWSIMVQTADYWSQYRKLRHAHPQLFEHTLNLSKINISIQIQMIIWNEIKSVYNFSFEKVWFHCINRKPIRMLQFIVILFEINFDFSISTKINIPQEDLKRYDNFDSFNKNLNKIGWNSYSYIVQMLETVFNIIAMNWNDIEFHLLLYYCWYHFFHFFDIRISSPTPSIKQLIFYATYVMC